MDIVENTSCGLKKLILTNGSMIKNKTIVNPFGSSKKAIETGDFLFTKEKRSTCY